MDLPVKNSINKKRLPRHRRRVTWAQLRVKARQVAQREKDLMRRLKALNQPTWGTVAIKPLSTPTTPEP